MLSFMVTVLIVLVFLIFIGDITRTNKREREWDKMELDHYKGRAQELEKEIRILNERLIVAKNRPGLNHSQKIELRGLIFQEIGRLKSERRAVKSTTIRTGHDVELVQTKLSDIDQMIDYYERIQSKLV